MRPRHASSPDVPRWRVRPAWYALHTRARRERKVVEALELSGIRCCFPVIPRRRRWYDRGTVGHQPLFPDYVFARVEPGAIPFMARLEGITDVVRSGHRPAAIPDEEVANIVRFARIFGEQGGQLVRVPYVGGRRARVTAGPFEGLVGTVADGERGRLVIGIQVIGIGLEIIVSEESLATLH